MRRSNEGAPAREAIAIELIANESLPEDLTTVDADHLSPAAAAYVIERWAP